MKQLINGELVDMTSEEISQRETEIENLKAERAAREAQAETDKQAKADLKASAKAKLIAGEKLTEEEANVLVGV